MHVDSKPIPVSNDTKSCRVCLETGAPGTLCQPCSCAGSMGHAHPSCIQRWIYERGEMTCEVCSDRYRGPFQPPPSVPPPRLTPPPLSQLGRSRGVFIAIDPVNEMYSWQANVAVVGRDGAEEQAHPAWCLAAVLVFMAVLLIRSVFETASPTAAAPPATEFSRGGNSSSIVVAWNFSASSFQDVAAMPVDPSAGSGEGASSMQLVGMLSGIAVLLLVAIIAMRLTPASADPPCDSNVEMLEGGVETHVHRGGVPTAHQPAGLTAASSSGMCIPAARACQWF